MTATARRPCSRCGRNQTRDRLIYSHYTKAYYCGPLEFDACDKRAMRRAKKVTPTFEVAVALAQAQWPPHSGSAIDRQVVGDAMLLADMGIEVQR